MPKIHILFLLLLIPIGSCDALFFRSLCNLRFFRLIFSEFCTNDEGTPSPTPSPRTYLLDDFKGLSNAYSMKKGEIFVNWDRSFLEELEGVRFDVFVANGVYNFTSALESVSVENLINIFSLNTTSQYFSVEADSKIIIETPFYGQNHSLLVKAQYNGEYSTNTKSTVVVASSMDPHIRDEVNVVGVFIPTPRVVITLEVAADVPHQLSFIGPVAPQARDLKVGDIVTGFTSDFDPFTRRIVAITRNTADGVVMTVRNVPLDVIFDALSVDATNEVSRTSSNDALRRRRLDIFSDAFNWVSDNVFEPIKEGIIDPIGDFISNTADALIDLFEDGKFEIKEKFSFVDVDEEFDEDLTEYIKFEGSTDADVSLTTNIQVTIVVPTYVKVGVNADLDMEVKLAFSGDIERNYTRPPKQIWSGKKWSRVLQVGPVPVQVYAEPSLIFDMEAKVTLAVESEFGFTVKGGAAAGVIYENGSGRTEKTDPFLDLDWIYPTIEATVKFEAYAGLTLALEIGIYEGLVAAEIGFRGEVDAAASGGILATNAGVIPIVKDFEVGLSFNIPFSASFLWDSIPWEPEDPIWEKKWVVITLPTAEIEVDDDHRCLLSANGDTTASFSLKAESEYDDTAFIKNPVGSTDWYLTLSNGWSISKKEGETVQFSKSNLISTSPEPTGQVIFTMQPKFPPLLKIVTVVSLDSLFPSNAVPCSALGPCDGGDFFDELIRIVGDEFNTEVFLSQPPDLSQPLVPSTVYKFEDFAQALKKLDSAKTKFQFWLGDDCSLPAQKAAMVNIAAFLGQSMRETIIYDACDENNWDSWRADIFKEPTSPPENLAALYPMSSGCGQLGQKYSEYRCDDECPVDLNMRINGTTNSPWIGAPPPLFCGPKSTYSNLGYWNPQQFCKGTDRSCVGQPYYYEGQTAGVHVSAIEDPRFPNFFYSNPLPDRNGVVPTKRPSSQFPSTNVEGCCWWGRGVIQTTGRCNFGKLNKQIGAGARNAGVENVLYPNLNFCTNPQVICTGPGDLKWIAGIFFWVTEPQSYNRNGYNFISDIKNFVSKGCVELLMTPDGSLDAFNQKNCQSFFQAASGIVNRGCHNPNDGGCPNCLPGATCDPAHNVPERVTASIQALRALLKYFDNI